MEQKQDRKVYEQPAVVYESELEVRAGSGIDSVLEPLDLFGEP